MIESHAKALGHSIHQQLIVFPLGLLATAVVFDVLRLATDNDELATASYYMIAAGIVGGLLAAMFGAVDYLAIPPGTRAKRVAAFHGSGNVVVVALFVISWTLRQDNPGNAASDVALSLAVAGFALAALTGWLGGELVDRLGVGVDPDAHSDAKPSYKTGIWVRPGATSTARER